MDVLQTVFGIDAVDLTRWFSCGIIPNPKVIAIGIENHRPLTTLLLEPVGILLSLLASELGIDSGLFGFDNAERFSIVILKHVIGIPFA